MLKRIKVLSSSLLLVCFAAVAGRSAGSQPREARDEGRIVTFQSGISPEARAKLIEVAGGRVLRDLPFVDGVVAEFPELGPKTAIGLSGLPSVEFVELNEYRIWLVALPGAALPSVGEVLRSAQENRHELPSPQPVPLAAPEDEKPSELPWGVARTKAPELWGRAKGAGVKVAVIDTGVDSSHPDLSPNYAGGFNALDAEAAPTDDHGHGTHVAGTIAAAHNGVGVIGVAPEAGIYAVKVLDGEGGGTLDGILRGIEWAVANRMHVVNMSLGGSHSAVMRKAVKKAHAAGVLIVAAAGNDPTEPVSAPAAYPETIAVSASTEGDGIAEFSSTGAEVDFIAPGDGIVSTWPGSKLAKLSGTSMACPHVSGLAALAVSMGARGPEGIRSALKRASVPIAGLEAPQQGAGMIEVNRWLK